MKTKMMTYNEAKVYLKPLKLKNKKEYDAWWIANKPDFLPQFPEEYYSAKREKVFKTISEIKPNQISRMDKIKLIKDILRLPLWRKEKKIIKRILKKEIESWTNHEFEFLTLINDKHNHSIIGIAGLSDYYFSEEQEIEREMSSRFNKAWGRLSQEPYTLWFRDVA